MLIHRQTAKGMKKSYSFYHVIKHEKTSTKNNSVTNSADVIVKILAVASLHSMASNLSLATISTAVEIEKNLEKKPS